MDHAVVELGCKMSIKRQQLADLSGYRDAYSTNKNVALGMYF